MNDLYRDEKDEQKYHFYFIYWDRDDSRIFVPRRLGFGWTLNFANPLSYVILIIIAAIIAYLPKIL